MNSQEKSQAKSLLESQSRNKLSQIYEGCSLYSNCPFSHDCNDVTSNWTECSYDSPDTIINRIWIYFTSELSSEYCNHPDCTCEGTYCVDCKQYL